MSRPDGAARLGGSTGPGAETEPAVTGEPVSSAAPVSSGEPVPSGEPDPTLAAYRQSIDNIDAAVIFMLAERFKITQLVGQHKAQAALPPADPQREHEQITRLRELSRMAQLDPEFSEKFLRFVITEVIQHHEQIREHQQDAELG